MSLVVRYVPHSAHINNGTVNAWINGLSSWGVGPGVRLMEVSAGSAVDREFVAVSGISPSIPVGTCDLSFLSTCGRDGVVITGAAGFTAYMREVAYGVTPTAIGTSNHITAVVTNGLIIPVSVSASHQGMAELQLMLHATQGAGSTNPIVYAVAQAIASGAGQTANVYTGGPVKFTSGAGSRFCQGIMQQRVNFGIGAQVFADTSEVYDTQVAILSRMSTFEFTTADVELISEIGDGLKLTAFAMYFRQKDANGQNVASATATHIGVSSTSGIITPGSVNLRHGAPGEESFTFTPVLNTNLITISTTSAIPTS